ncbi:DUF4362 domain-containing protein [Tetzosporium hominis]|uniref:DUF4362 domain-containing protein n=1 Tax=Tetzosporium hominis TaxID=2020506 RepID=UPI0013FDE5A3|nr:DUF4362 domain-containing protein [Tetzosporium hominis]
MKKLFIIMLLTSSILAACQSNEVAQVINRQGDFENLQNLNPFIENVKVGTPDRLHYISYGEEGEEITSKLVFDGNKIKSSLHVGWPTIEEYECETAEKQEFEETISLYLRNCSGDFEGDLELISYPLNSDED